MTNLMIAWNILLAGGPLPDPKALHSPASVTSDPLIDHGGQVIVYIGTALLVVGIAAVVGFWSRRVEHALVTAFVLSLGLIAFFVLGR